MSKDGSSSKKGIAYWPGKEAVEVSNSISQSKDVADSEIYSTNAMDEYIRKQKEKQAASTAVKTQPSAEKKDPVSSSIDNTKRSGKTSSKEFSESSDKYSDEGFESISKSQSVGLPKMTAQPSTFQPPTRIAQTYVKKENKFA